MKQYLFFTALLCIVMVFTPLICVAVINTTDDTADKDEKVSNAVTVMTLSGKTTQTDLKDYLIGCVSGEMPASFSSEALRAQAVASFTYYRWLKENSDNAEFYISADSKKHQAYLTNDELKEKWGDKYESYYSKVEQAVLSVMGECVMYEGEPALTVFHAISSGQTLSSEAVWGEAIPYLQSVNAPGDKLSPDYETTAEYTQNEIISRLSLESSEGNLINNIDTDENGYVNKISIGKKSYSGNEFYSLLGLPSPVFTAEYKDGKYIFNVTGRGHGVGMSQYSADYMARQGSTYKEILTHFYKGTYIDKIL